MTWLRDVVEAHGEPMVQSADPKGFWIRDATYPTLGECRRVAWKWAFDGAIYGVRIDRYATGWHEVAMWSTDVRVVAMMPEEPSDAELTNMARTVGLLPANP